MTEREALKLALEALEKFRYHVANNYEINSAIVAAREALAQPEQEYDWKDLYEKEKRSSAMWIAKYEEVAGPAPKAYPVAQPEHEPVAIVHRNEYNEYRLEPHDKFDIKSIPFNVDVPLFKSPQRTWVGLTDEECRLIYTSAMEAPARDQVTVCKAIEAKLKKKNT